MIDIIVMDDSMAETGVAKVFMHGRSQAVRLPAAFRVPGDRVRVRLSGLPHVDLSGQFFWVDGLFSR
jgi:hypothetical protein